MIDSARRQELHQFSAVDKTTGLGFLQRGIEPFLSDANLAINPGMKAAGLSIIGGRFGLNLTWQPSLMTFDPLMEIEKKINGDTCELMMAGRVDGAAANQLEVEVLAAMRAGAKTLYVNLAHATFLCSAGIRVLLQYHRQMKGKGLTFLVTRPSPEVTSALEMTGFPELVEK